jgi:hypothetical protein
MTMDELRRQLETVQFPIFLRVDGKEVAVSRREDVMVPIAGTLVCVYDQGAFQVIDCEHVSIIGRPKSATTTAS